MPMLMQNRKILLHELEDGLLTSRIAKIAGLACPILIGLECIGRGALKSYARHRRFQTSVSKHL